MITYPKSVIIGKRGATAPTSGTAPAIGNVGFVGVTDKDKKVLTTMTGYEDVIYITNVKKGGYDDSGNLAGRYYYSSPIYKDKIVSVTADRYIVGMPHTWTIDFSKVDVSELGYGREYVIRVISKDIWEHPGQFSQTYRILGKNSDTKAIVATRFAELISKTAKDNRFTAADDGSGLLTITAKERTDTNGLYSINQYEQVNIKVVAWNSYVNGPTKDGKGDFMRPWITDADGFLTETAQPKPGKGNWKLVRDDEKEAQGWDGVTNPLMWPFIANSMLPSELYTVEGEKYATIVITHDVPYQSPDNNYVKETRVQTVIYLPGAYATKVVSSAAAWDGGNPDDYSLNVFTCLTAFFGANGVTVNVAPKVNNDPLPFNAFAVLGDGINS